MTKFELIEKLSKYLPDGTASYVVELMILHKVQLKLNKPRSSKFGDYRSPHKHDNYHRITVNKDLNPYAFLTTLLHEIAHLIAFERYRNTIDPHGKEWKACFSELLKPIVLHHQLPNDIQQALHSYTNHLKASSCSDKNLMKVLAKYDKDAKLLLEQIPEGSLFKLETGRIFKKGKQLRTWFQCFEQPSNKEYRVSGISKVEIVRL